MRCQKAKKMISLYIDSEMRGVAAEDLLVHINACAKCRKEMEFMSKTMKNLPVSQTLRVSPYFFAGVREKIIQGKKESPVFFPLNLKPAFLGISLFSIIIIFSALTGIFLGETYWTQATNSELSLEEAKSSFNLGVFEDIPDGSLGDFHNEILGGA